MRGGVALYFPILKFHTFPFMLVSQSELSSMFFSISSIIQSPKISLSVSLRYSFFVVRDSEIDSRRVLRMKLHDSQYTLELLLAALL